MFVVICRFWLFVVCCSLSFVGSPGGPGPQCGPGGQGGPGDQGAVHPMRRQIFANTVGRICKLNLTERCMSMTRLKVDVGEN